VPAFSEVRAHAFVKHVEIGFDGVCMACLSFVIFPLADGDERTARRELRRVTRDIWHDGFDKHALAAVRRAVMRSVPDARDALADLELNGGRSVTARALVSMLAEREARRIRSESRLRDLARDRLDRSWPELN
jgi:hypothetical protein